MSKENTAQPNCIYLMVLIYLLSAKEKSSNVKSLLFQNQSHFLLLVFYSWNCSNVETVLENDYVCGGGFSPFRRNFEMLGIQTTLNNTFRTFWQIITLLQKKAIYMLLKDAEGDFQTPCNFTVVLKCNWVFKETCDLTLFF